MMIPTILDVLVPVVSIIRRLFDGCYCGGLHIDDGRLLGAAHGSN